MSIDPKQPAPPPGRIILPGEDRPEPEEGGGRLVVPGEERAEERAAPRIVRPPGATGDDESIPEYPKLRPLILVPFSDGQRELLLINDPLGVLTQQPVLSAESLPLLQLFDGTASLTDITAAVMRESKDLRVGQMIRDFVAQLDRMLLLESPRFDTAYRELREQYHRLEIRQAAHENRSYPGERAAAQSFLDAQVAEAEGWRRDAGEPAAAAGARPRALAVPHLDPRRAGAAIARGYLELGVPLDGPVRFVVFGTGHSLFGDTFALTRKHFETPLGRVECDLAFVDALAGQLGELAYHGELAHRDEHSIEFQALYLAHRLAGQPFTIVPILCGGFHALLDEHLTPREDLEFETMLQAVREAAAASKTPTVYVAGIDFSHVGPRFGDPAVDERTKQEVETKDRAALEAALRGDADGWFRAIAEHEDSTRICGWAPMYALLRCAEVGAGRLLRYEQSMEGDGSMVTVATAVWG